jgi:hypothetical protein
MSTQAPARTAAEIAFECRVNRLVDKWVSGQYRLSAIPLMYARHPNTWTDGDWDIISMDAGERRGDGPPDEAMREAVIREIDAIQTALERRRRSA